jgi:hypothetical protein
MSRDALLPLETERLFQQVEQVDCYLCGAENNFDVELCTHCSAPMALAHQARAQGVRPRMAAVLGSSGAGKTVYLGLLLDMLARRADQLQVVARGAFSLSLQQHVAASLARGAFPEKTPGEPDRWNWIHCQVRSARRRPVDLVVPDVAGEALFEELERPGALPAIGSLLKHSCAALVLIDAAELKAGRQDPDYFGMKILAALLDQGDAGGRGWRRRPVALVLTKADCCEECLDDPRAFVARHAAGLARLVEERFTQVRYFAAGVAGACAYRLGALGRQRIPLRIEPRGIVEPFAWLVDRV